MTDTKPYQKFAWLCTAGVLGSAILAAFDIYPLYVIGFGISSIMWTIIGVLWKERSLIVLNASLTIVYLVGLIHSWLN